MSNSSRQSRIWITKIDTQIYLFIKRVYKILSEKNEVTSLKNGIERNWNSFWLQIIQARYFLMNRNPKENGIPFIWLNFKIIIIALEMIFHIIINIIKFDRFFLFFSILWKQWNRKEAFIQVSASHLIHIEPLIRIVPHCTYW